MELHVSMLFTLYCVVQYSACGYAVHVWSEVHLSGQSLKAADVAAL